MKFTIRICNATPHRNKAILLYDDGDYAEGFVISHDMSKSNNTFHKLRKNPVKEDTRDSFISHQLRRGKIGDKELFGTKVFSDYEFSEEDLADIEKIYKAKKVGKPWNYYLVTKKACHTVESKHATTTICAKQCINNNFRKNNKSRKNNK